MKQQVINLANSLIAQLGSPDRTDTFSRWVAHYLAEQMTLAAEASGAEKTAAEERCFNSILALWAHRNSLPDGLRPFEGFEPILRALARLDPDQPRSAYLDALLPAERKNEPTEVDKLVAMAVSVDRVARIVMDFILTEAAAKAANTETRTMLENALPTALKGDLESIHEFMRRRELLEKGGELLAEAQARRRERIAQLDRFCALCQTVRKELVAGAKPLPRKAKTKKSIVQAAASHDSK